MKTLKYKFKNNCNTNKKKTYVVEAVPHNHLKLIRKKV